MNKDSLGLIATEKVLIDVKDRSVLSIKRLRRRILGHTKQIQIFRKWKHISKKRFLINLAI